MTGAPGFAGVDRRSGEGIVRVVLGEDESLLRRQLLLALEAHPRIEVLAEVIDTDMLVQAVQGGLPDVVVLDARFPPAGILEAVVALRAVLPVVAVVVITDAGLDAPAMPDLVEVPRQEAGVVLAATVVAVADGQAPPGR